MSTLERSTTNTGYIVGSKDGELLRVDTDTHLISIARTGGGKGKTVAIPNLLDHEGSVLSLEIDGETLLATEFYRRNILKQQIRILDPFHATEAPERDSINILDALDPSSPLFSADAKIVAKSIVKTDSGAESPDPYWTNKSVELLTSLIIYAKIDPRVADEDRNLSFVASIVSSFGSEEWEMHMLRLTSDTSIFKSMLKGAGSYFYNSSGPIINSNTSSIISVLSGYMDFARDPQIQRYSDRSTFTLKELAGGNTTVYIVMPSVDYFTAFNTWVRLLVERTIAVIPIRTGKKHLIRKENRILFMLDEFTQLGKLDGVDQGMQTCRHKGITLWLLFQDLSRLRLVYGNEVAESFLGAASCIQAFEITERETTKYLSDRAGKKVIYIANTSLSESLGSSDTMSSSEARTLSNSRSLADRRGSGNGGSTSTSITNPEWLISNTTVAYSSNQQYSQDTTVTTTSSESSNYQAGKAQTRSHTRNLGLSYQGQIVPALEPTEITRLTSRSTLQLLSFYDGEVVITERADWLSLPQLRERVEGPVEAPQLPEVPCIPLESENLFEKIDPIVNQLSDCSQAINQLLSTFSRSNALSEYPFDGSHIFKLNSIENLIELCIVGGVENKSGEFRESPYFCWFCRLVDRLVDDIYIKSKQTDFPHKWRMSSGSVIHLLTSDYIIAFDEFAKLVADQSLQGLTHNLTLEILRLSESTSSLKCFIENLRSSVSAIEDYPRQLEEYYHLRNFRPSASETNFHKTLAEIRELTSRIPRSLILKLIDEANANPVDCPRRLINLFNGVDKIEEILSDTQRLFQNERTRSDLLDHLIDECTRFLEGELQDDLECSIKELLRIKECLHDESRQLYNNCEKYGARAFYNKTHLRDYLNQMLLKDLDESNQQDLLAQFTSGYRSFEGTSGLFFWFSACSNRVKSVCDALVLLEQILSFTTQCLFIDYLHLLYTTSTLAEEIESKLTFFSELPIWERLREQEEAGPIKNVSTDIPAFIPNPGVSKSSVFLDCI